MTWKKVLLKFSDYFLILKSMNNFTKDNESQFEQIEAENENSYENLLFNLLNDYWQQNHILEQENPPNLWHKKEELLLKLIDELGVLSTKFWKNSIKEKFKNRARLWSLPEEVELKTWNNCFFVLWSFPNLKKIIDLWIVEAKNIQINAQNWVNFQERIKFWQIEWELWKSKLREFNSWDKLEYIKIFTWNNCSFPHWVSFYNWSHNSIEIMCWDWVFLWLNSLIWSGTKIWNNSSIWLWVHIWNDVKIWENVLIWQSSTIESWVEIDDDILVPNFNKLEKWYEVFTFQEIMENYEFYLKRHDFAIKLSKDKKQREEQLIAINDYYAFVDFFNMKSVVPENKVFAEIDNIFNYLYDKIWYESFKIYEYDTRFDILEKKQEAWTLDRKQYFKLKFWTDWKSRLVTKSYPKNVQEFLFTNLVLIIQKIEEFEKSWDLEFKKQDLYDEINSLMNIPKIEKETIRENFFWDNYLTWKFEYDKDCLFFNVKSRWDELKSWENIKLKNVIYLWGVIHWPGNKEITNTNLYDVISHWWVDYKDSNLWSFWKRSVFNAAIINKATIPWNTVVNGWVFNNISVWEGFSVAWLTGKKAVYIENSQLWEKININSWKNIVWQIIWDNGFIEDKI